MKKLTLFAAALFVAATAAAAELNETIDRTFDVRPGATVSLDNVNGSITIASWDQPRVRVVAHKTVEGDKREAQQALKDLRVEITPRDGGLNVMTHYPKESEGVSGIFAWLTGDHIDAQVRYELTVPKTMSLDVDNTNGNIRVTDVAGKHELETTNGRIETVRCAGSLDASTTNGRIEAELVRLNRGQENSLATTNGRIIVTIPADFAGELDAGTTNGSIKTDFPVTATRAGDNRLRGTINGGGAPLKLRTTNGGIEIRKF
jgi:Putative adhesin